MGNLDTDPMAVVDIKLRVFGVPNLRIVDTSIIPILPSGHSQIPAYGLERRLLI